jgi:hypothetical protein
MLKLPIITASLVVSGPVCRRPFNYAPIRACLLEYRENQCID